MSPQFQQWMRLALEEASAAASRQEVPVGAVVVLGERLLAREHNRTLELGDPTAHAEILALRRAARELGNYRLTGCTLFVTLEPCPMCAGALIWARISTLIFGTRDEKAGSVLSRTHLLEPGRFNHAPRVVEGVLAPQARQLLQDFFARRRARASKTD